MRRRTAVHRGVALLLAVVACFGALAWPSAADPRNPAEPAAPASQTGDVPVVFLDGKGFGHGVGLSQWGSEYMARTGLAHRDILTKFYPGTTLGTATGYVRVAVLSATNNVTTLEFPQGGQVRSNLSGAQAKGFPVEVPAGGRIRIRFDGSYHVDEVVAARSSSHAQVYRSAGGGGDCIPLLTCPTTTQPGGGGGGGGSGCVLCSTTTTKPPTTTTKPPTSTSGGNSTTTTRPAAPSTGAPVWAVPKGGGYVTALDRDRSYRGALEATAGAGPLRLINQIDIESYLKGMAEVPSTWPQEAIAAQTVAARTWALRAMQFSGELCDYDRCQVYVGVTREAPGQNAAVDATRGEVLRFGSALASTVYSADAGGVSATTLEGFGTPDGRYPYLTTVRYKTDNPLPWRTVVALDDVAARFGYGGAIKAIKISEPGPSGRALVVTLSGTAGDKRVDGRSFASSLGLRSTLFVPTLGTADKAPPPPNVGGLVDQALPDDVDAIKDAARTTAPALATPVGASVRFKQQSLLDARTGPIGAMPGRLIDELAVWLAMLMIFGVAFAARRANLISWSIPIPISVPIRLPRRRR